MPNKGKKNGKKNTHYKFVALMSPPLFRLTHVATLHFTERGNKDADIKEMRKQG